MRRLAFALLAAAATPALAHADDEPIMESMHGFRMGYSYVNVAPGESSALASPHLFVLGYELTQRVLGGGMVDVVVVENVAVTGLNQSILIPSGNLLLGLELNKMLQLGAGAQVAPLGDQPFHMVVAAGFSPPSGDLNVPLHVAYIPDVHGNWRLVSTIGVNW